MSPPAPRNFYAVVSAVGISQIVHFGALYYTLTVLGGAIQRDLGLNLTTVFAGASLSMLVSALLSGFAGRLIDRHGGARVMAAGAALAALGFTLTALSTGPWLYFTAWLVNGVAMSLCLYDPAFASIARVLGGETRRGISYVALWGGFASTVFWPLVIWLEAAWGWRQAMLIVAAINLLCVPLHLYFLRAPQAADSARPAAPEIPAALKPEDFRPAAILLALWLLLNSFMAAGLAMHLLAMMRGFGLTGADALLIGAMLGPAQVAGRIGELAAGGRYPALHTGVFSAALFPFSLALLLGMSGGFATAAVFIILYGIANGLTTIARGQVPLALFGSHGFGGRLGSLVAPSKLASALAPVAFAFIMEQYGLTALLIVCLVSASGSLAAISLAAARARGA